MRLGLTADFWHILAWQPTGSLLHLFWALGAQAEPTQVKLVLLHLFQSLLGLESVKRLALGVCVCHLDALHTDTLADADPALLLLGDLALLGLGQLLLLLLNLAELVGLLGLLTLKQSLVVIPACAQLVLFAHAGLRID